MTYTMTMKRTLTALAPTLISLVVMGTLVGSLSLLHAYQAQKAEAATTQQIGAFPYFIAGSGISSSATSITLTSLKMPQTGALITTSMLSSTFYITLEPGSTARQEFASCTTVTQNSAGTATLSGCTRGLLPFTPYTASTTYAFSHSGGTTAIFSNAPQIYNQYGGLANSETVTGTWTFNAFPVTPSTPAATQSVAGFTTISTALQAASSTALAAGPSGTTYVLPTSIATDTPVIGCAVGYTATLGAGCVPIANLQGKINANYIATSSNYAWTGTASFATTSFSAPATFASTTVGLDWQWVASSTITSGNTATLTANWPTGFRRYRVIVTGYMATADQFAFRLNGDSGSSYKYRNFVNYSGSTAQNTDTQAMLETGSYDSTTKMNVTIDLDNATGGMVRPFSWAGSVASTTYAGANVPNIISGAGAYYAAASSTQITSFTFRAYAGAQINATSSVSVYGSNN